MDLFENAHWIMCKTGCEKIVDKAFIYKQGFNVKAGCKLCLNISAHSQYAVFLNGVFCDAGQYDDYENYQVYDTLDITNFSVIGENELVIWHYVSGENFSASSIQTPGIIFSLYCDDECILSSSEKTLSAEDKRVLGLCEKLTPQLAFNLDFDATAQIGEFRESKPANRKKSLYPRPVKKLVYDNKISGKLVECGEFRDVNRTLVKSLRMQNSEINKLSENAVFEDYPKNAAWKTSDSSDGVYLLYDCDESAGFISFSIEVPEKCEILIGFGEHLDDGRVRTYIGNRHFCYRYIAHAGKNEFFYPLRRIGLRYLGLQIYSKTGKVNYAGIMKQHYPLNVKKPDIKNPLHRKIYDIGCNTLSLCMHEHYEDCPWREQSLYAMDSRIQALCGYYAFEEYKFPAASFSLMAKSLREDGLLELCAPGKVPVVIPSFTAVYIRDVLECVEYSGDLSLAEEVFGTLEVITSAFEERITEKGLIPLYRGQEYWNFYEWREGLDGEGTVSEEKYDSPLNAFVADAFYCMGKICELLKRDSSEKYFKLSKKLISKIQECFWCEEENAYRTFENQAPAHVLTQALMLFVGVVPENKRKAVAENIINKNLIPSSVSMLTFVYEALLGTDENYISFVTEHIEKIWGAMLEKDCQTFWETELGASDFSNAGSLCHGWSAVPVYIFGKYLYGF